MMGSLIPAWFLLEELEVSLKRKLLVGFFIIIWPETLLSMTFMSEPLFWLCFFSYIYLWIRNQRKKSLKNAVVLSCICYLGYLTKEVFLAVFISSIFFEIICYIFPGIIAAEVIPKKRNCRWPFMLSICRNTKKLVYEFVFLGVFLFLHVILKMTLFRESENYYSKQMSLEVLGNPYNILYMIYSLFYYISAILLTLLVIPFSYLFSNFCSMPLPRRKMFIFVLTFLAIVLISIPYSISVREDLGRAAPRIHLRYISPALAVVLVLFLSNYGSQRCMSSIKYRNSFVYLTILLSLFVVLIFTGVTIGSSVDQESLEWYRVLQSKSNIGNTILKSAFCIFVAFYIFAYEKRSEISSWFYIVAFLLVCIYSCISSYSFLKKSYYIPEDNIKEVNKIENYLDSIDDGNLTIVYFTDGITHNYTGKLMDTYMDRVEGFYYIDDTVLNDIELGKEFRVHDIVWQSSIFNEPYFYDIEKIDYIIAEKSNKAMKACLYDGFEIIDEASGMLYTVYKNTDSDKLLLSYNPECYFTGSDLTVYFSGEKYNADEFEVEGISGNEGAFSWTDGDILRVCVPSTKKSGRVDVDVTVFQTFNGSKSWSVGEYEGVLDGNGVISFSVDIIDGKIEFNLLCKDSEVVNFIVPESSDFRKVAFAIEKLTITEH